MPASVKTPEVKEFRLELLDEREGVSTEEKTTVTIRQATVRQNAERSTLFSEFIREFSDDGQTERTIVRLPMYKLISDEVYLTLVGCNMTTADGTKPLFRFAQGPNGSYLDMTKRDFLDAWGLLDDMTAAEIHSKVLEVNPHWQFGVGDESLGE